MALPRPSTVARFNYRMGEFEMYVINRFGPLTNRLFIDNQYGSLADCRDEATGEPLAKRKEVDISDDSDDPDFTGVMGGGEAGYSLCGQLI